MNLKQYGWNNFFEKQYKEKGYEGMKVGRVIIDHNNVFQVVTEDGEIVVELSGKVLRGENGRTKPSVGDWVVLQKREDKWLAEDVLPRKSKFSRKMAGNDTLEQIVATNIDTIFIVSSLNHDFNLRRLERYLIVAWDSGATPVIILSKSDLCEDADEKIEAVEEIAPGVQVHSISALEAEGMEQLKQYLGEGKTIALIGSSGVGKSTLLNTLAGEELLKVSGIREDDDRGKHTTTHRQLVLLPSGGMILDTPGMRELQLWQADEGIDHVFSDIQSLADQCKFTDCKHESEPGCAVLSAISSGIMKSDRLESYIKLKKELAFVERKQLERQRAEQKRAKRFEVRR
ncbi:MAG: ribosome small subunit-dependent GTPase A [Vallitaleaceae bacterium]|nr:ribosome small subunit-dependent GTPase A [Vallitaleaceae bacterium]